MVKKVKIFEDLERIAPLIPAPIYWLDKNGALLGMNKQFISALGSNTIGKTAYDVHPKEIAEKIARHNEEVMQSGKIGTQEEAIKDLDTGKIRYFASIKAPLHDEDGKVIGIIGTSVETTRQKETDLLQIENTAHKVQLAEQEKFQKIANQVAHDIRSPLAALSMIVKSCDDIPESERISLREVATNISDIANNLLNQYKAEKECDNNTYKSREGHRRQPVAVSLLLLQVLTAKKYQFKELPIKFNCNFDRADYFAFINVEPSNFIRMMSNLINNAVDAFEEKEGTINLILKIDSSQVKIIIQDNAKGMPAEVVNKIMSGIAVTSSKKDSHGIGLMQVHETLKNNQGELSIDSKIGQGTNITLTFSRVSPPEWIAQEIKLNKGDTVVILDDDSSIHGAWDTRFKPYESDINIRHFTDGEETINFINSLTTNTKNKVLLLSDFELLKQNLNGLDVIARTNAQCSILVTSHYAKIDVQRLATKTGTKILPKQLASEVFITIGEREDDDGDTGTDTDLVAYTATDSTSTDDPNDPKTVDLVIIDDNELFANSLARLISLKANKTVDKYYKPKYFLENLTRYPKTTKICTDYDLGNRTMNGVDLAKKLYEAGFTQIYLLTGMDFQQNDVPEFVRVITKGDPDNIIEALF